MKIAISVVVGLCLLIIVTFGSSAAIPELIDPASLAVGNKFNYIMTRYATSDKINGTEYTPQAFLYYAGDHFTIDITRFTYTDIEYNLIRPNGSQIAFYSPLDYYGVFPRFSYLIMLSRKATWPDHIDLNTPWLVWRNMTRLKQGLPFFATSNQTAYQLMLNDPSFATTNANITTGTDHITEFINQTLDTTGKTYTLNYYFEETNSSSSATGISTYYSLIDYTVKIDYLRSVVSSFNWIFKMKLTNGTSSRAYDNEVGFYEVPYVNTSSSRLSVDLLLLIPSFVCLVVLSRKKLKKLVK